MTEALFELSHSGLETEKLIGSITVGGVAVCVNNRLKFRGEDFRLEARKVGAILKSLGIHSERLGRLGRGLHFASPLRRKIHQIARHMLIDRRYISSLAVLEHGNGGARCLICEEFGTTGGLRFADTATTPQATTASLRRGRLFHIDGVEKVLDCK